MQFSSNSYTTLYKTIPLQPIQWAHPPILLESLLHWTSILAAHRPHSANFLFPQHSILVTIPIPLEHQKYSTVRLYYTEVLFQERSFYRRTGFITAQNPFRQAAVRITPKKLSLTLLVVWSGGRLIILNKALRLKVCVAYPYARAILCPIASVALLVALRSPPRLSSRLCCHKIRTEQREQVQSSEQ